MNSMDAGPESRVVFDQQQVPRRCWLPWVLGSALLASVGGAAVQLAEEREFARLVEAPRVVRDRQILATATAWQLAIVLLDAATMSVCIRAVGAHAPADAVFASFISASLVRTMGVVQAAWAPTRRRRSRRFIWLRLMSRQLSATLIFRGLRFWIPMLPGLWSSRRILRPGS